MNRIIVNVHHVLFCFLLYRQQQQIEAFACTTRASSHRRFSSLLATSREQDVPDLKRRQTCQTIISLTTATVLTTTTTTTTNTNAITTDMLASRVNDNTQTPPSYGLEGADVYYPSWFEGKWKIQSSCTSIEAPCGIALFGGNRTWENAQLELKDPPLVYEARFLRLTENQMVADREFNVRSIAQAVMGPQSVLDIPLATPNKLTCILVPTGAPSPFQVDLITLLRKQETPAMNLFDCSEVSREIITTTTGSSSSSSRSTVLKEIETISLYSYDDDSSTHQPTIQCRQRSAKFLLPSQQDPTALRLWQMTGGRPVDVRYYNVSYKRV